MRLTHAIAVLAVVGLGAGSLALARANPFGSLAGGSTVGLVALAGAGWVLVAGGVAARRLSPESRFGALLTMAGIAWLLAEFDNPGAGSALTFTVGLLAYAAAPPVLAHAALAYPGGRVARRSERAVLAVAYAGTLGILGLLHALVFAPRAAGCFECPSNLLVVHGDAAVAQAVDRAGVLAGFGWSVALIAVLALAVARATPAARRARAPVVLPAIAYLALVAAEYQRSVGRGTLSNEDADRALFSAQAIALGAVVCGVLVSRWQARRSRMAVARLAVELDDAPPLGRLRDALSRALHDPRLELAFPAGEDRHVNAEGRPVDPGGQADTAVTPLLRGPHTVALLIHRADLLEDPALLEEVGAAARLALEHERLQAEARAQLEELRASRARALQAGDAERRRLERDLHDGAQQRLVGIALALRLLRSRVAPSAASHLDAADEQLQSALADLRELARGIYPAVLVESGLLGALEALAESAPVPIVLEAVTEERLPEPVEAAAYFLVAHVLRHATPARLTIRALRRGECLTLELAIDGGIDANVAAIHDRIGALDGTLAVDRTPAATTIRAEVPCAS